MTEHHHNHHSTHPRWLYSRFVKSTELPSMVRFLMRTGMRESGALATLLGLFFIALILSVGIYSYAERRYGDHGRYKYGYEKRGYDRGDGPDYHTTRHMMDNNY